MIEVVGVLVAGSFDFRLLQQYRHETDMPITLRDVRFQGQSGKHMLALSFSGFDPTRTLGAPWFCFPKAFISIKFRGNRSANGGRRKL